MKLKSIKSSFGGKTLTKGTYVCVIKSIAKSDLDPENKKERPWVDQTEQIVAVFEDNDGEGTIKHWFNETCFINKKDYSKVCNAKGDVGMFYGQEIPKGTEFASTEGHSEEYLMNSKTKKRLRHTLSLVNIGGKEKLMQDSDIDSALELGKEITIVRESKSRTAERIFGEFIANCGIEEGEEISDLSELAGREVGVEVRNIEGRLSEKGNPITEVHYFCTAEKAEAKLAKIDA